MIYLDLGDDERIVHYNPIQMKRGSNPKATVASIVRATRRVWSKYWDMDVEGLLNAGVSTLVTINQVLAERGQPQFSLGDLPYLFYSETIRRRLLNEFITDPLLTYFWMGCYERDLQEHRAEKFLDCLSLVNNSILPHRANLILSQSSSSLDWNEVLTKRCIIFIKTDAERSRWENQHWPAACLLEQLLSAAREKPTNAKGHPNEVLSILVSGLEPLIYPDRIGMLEELTDRGVTFTCSVSSLAELDKGLIPLTAEMLSQAPNIFAFSLTPADAETLEG